MKDYDLYLWIMDTLMEGEYAIRHLYDYIHRGDINLDEFIEAIRDIWCNDYIIFTQQAKNGKKFLNNVEVEKVLHDASQNLNKDDDESDAYYHIYIELSEAGDRYIASKGFHL